MRRPSVWFSLAQADVGFERGAMRFLNRGDGLGKKNLRPLDEPIFAAGGFQCGECVLVNPGHVQRFQIEGRSLASQRQRRPAWRDRPRTLPQVFSQRRHISL